MSIVFLDFHVDDIESTIALYDLIQVWRASVVDGTYVEVTGNSPIAARIVGTVAGPWTLTGLGLSVAADGVDPVAVTFPSDPVSLFKALQAINAAVPGVASESALNSGKVALTSLITGTASSVVVSGTAAAALGLSTVKVNGKTERISLTRPTEFYAFTDYDGDQTFFYKTRFYNSVTSRVSEFSLPRQGAPQDVLDSTVLSLATIDLADGAGRPVVGRRIILVVQQVMLIPDSTYGVLSGADKIIVLTDYKGHAETNLVIGMTYRLLIEGAQFERSFVVPNESSFNLLQVATEAPDPFSVVQAPPRPIQVS